MATSSRNASREIKPRYENKGKRKKNKYVFKYYIIDILLFRSHPMLEKWKKCFILVEVGGYGCCGYGYKLWYIIFSFHKSTSIEKYNIISYIFIFFLSFCIFFSFRYMRVVQ